MTDHAPAPADQTKLNTDRELYREPKGDLPSDYYANSVHVTDRGHIGMNVGGNVYTLPIAEWHALAATRHAAEVDTAETIVVNRAVLNAILRGNEAAAAYAAERGLGVAWDRTGRLVTPEEIRADERGPR